MNNIKVYREHLGLTQKELAKAANISAPFLYDLENGNRNAKPDTWQRIASALSCTVNELTGKEGELISEA